MTDPWDFNNTNDPHLVLARAQLEVARQQVAEMARATDAQLAAIHHNTTAPAPAPGPVQYHKRRNRFVTAALRLFWVCVALGAIATITAWGLAFASATGFIAPPPALTTTTEVPVP